jgi:GNAT superfamily N-acetyltransferase
MRINIRKAVPNDADAIERLASEFADYLRTLGDTDNFQFADLFVQENQRLRGVGRRLMESAVDIC